MRGPAVWEDLAVGAVEVRDELETAIALHLNRGGEEERLVAFKPPGRAGGWPSKSTGALRGAWAAEHGVATRRTVVRRSYFHFLHSSGLSRSSVRISSCRSRAREGP